MTTQATTSPRAIRGLDPARVWLDSTRNQAITAAVLYAAVVIGFFGLHVLPHFGSVCVCQPGPADSTIFMWSLAWWPHAVLHGMNPFVSNAVFAPDHVNIGGVTSIPGAAIVLAPITLLFGAIAAYNVLMLASPVLAAFFAFLLCRYVTGKFVASLVGGYLFGFSAYMFGQLLGHAHMVLVFPIPAAVHLTLRLIDGRIGRWRFVVLMALTLIGLLLFSTEVALTSVLLGGVALVVAFAIAPASRSRMLATVKPLLAAGAVALVITSPAIFYALKGVPQLSPMVGDIVRRRLTRLSRAHGGDRPGEPLLHRCLGGVLGCGYRRERDLRWPAARADRRALRGHPVGSARHEDPGHDPRAGRRPAPRLPSADRRPPHDPAAVEAARPLAAA